MWTLIAAYFVQVFLAAGSERAASLGDVAGFLAIAAGGVGSVVAGRWADQWGRERVASGAMLVSGACALAAGWMIGLSPWLVVPLGLVWGFAVVADSAKFSALVTEVAPAHAVGTALTLQTSLGFALTAASIALTIELVAAWGWGVAFAGLAVGPVFGIASMVRLKNMRLRRQEGSLDGSASQGGL